MITSKELIRDTEKILNYCRRLLLALTMVINILRKRKLSAQESCYFREKIRKTSLKLLYSTAELETKHDLREAIRALPRRSECPGIVKTENLSVIEDFSELLSGIPSRSASLLSGGEHRIRIIEMLREELCGAEEDSGVHEILFNAIDLAMFMLAGGGVERLSIASTANIKEPLTLNDRLLVMYMKGEAARAAKKICSGMQNLVTWVLPAVSLPNLAKQLGSDSASALDRFLAAGGMVLYLVAILATVFSFLFRVKMQSKVCRKLANIGLVSVVYALFFSVAFYIPGSHRWLISLPCVILVPAFCVALKQ